MDIRNMKCYTTFLQRSVSRLSNNKTGQFMRNVVTKILLICLWFIGLNSYAQGWQATYNQGNAREVLQTSDSRFVVAGNTDTAYLESYPYLMQVEADGRVLWNKTYTQDGYGIQIRSMIQLMDGNFMMAGEQEGLVYVLKANRNGDFLWSATYTIGLETIAWSLAETQDGSVGITGHFISESSFYTEMFLLKIDNNSNFILSKSYKKYNDTNHFSFDIVANADNGFFLAGYGGGQDTEQHLYCIKTDLNGDTLWTVSYPQATALETTQTLDGSFLAAGYTNETTPKPIITKIDANGSLVWAKTYSALNEVIDIYDIVVTPKGSIALLSNDLTTTDGNTIVLASFDQNGNYFDHQRYGGNTFSRAFSLKSTDDDGFIMAGYKVGQENLPFSLLIKTNNAKQSFSKYILGNAFLDTDDDCQIDVADIELENWIIQAINQVTYDTLYTNTDINGNYELAVDSGTYVVSLIHANHLFESPCGNHIEVVSGIPDTMYLDFPTKESMACPYMTVDISTPLLRRCTENNYTIAYCNNGTSPGTDAYVELFVDDFLTITESSLAWETPVINNTYIFQLGDVQIGEWGNFTLTAAVSCDAILGQAHCITANIFPDEICSEPDPSWDGSFITTDIRCLDDGSEQVEVIITNIGDFDMALGAGYEVYEDDLMRIIGNTQLNSEEEETITLPATGGTIRVEVEQAPGLTIASFPRDVLEGCGENTDGSFSIGFATTVFEDDFVPYRSIDCRQNIDAMASPIETLVTPSGVYDEHYINATDELDYEITFQNTGTDTAFLVIVRDTLSPHLDITTLQLGAASHPYTFRIQQGRVLEWTFEDIAIPDSTTDSKNSVGMVKFRIGQKPNNPNGTVIENQADIYMNFNPVVSGNTTFNTIGENFFVIDLVSVPTIHVPDVSLNIYPNPFTEYATVELSGASFKDLQFTLLDAQGRVVKQVYAGHQQQFVFDGKGLSPGIFVYIIREGTQQIATGKVQIQ